MRLEKEEEVGGKEKYWIVTSRVIVVVSSHNILELLSLSSGIFFCFLII